MQFGSCLWCQTFDHCFTFGKSEKSYIVKSTDYGEWETIVILSILPCKCSVLPYIVVAWSEENNMKNLRRDDFFCKKKMRNLCFKLIKLLPLLFCNLSRVEESAIITGYYRCYQLLLGLLLVGVWRNFNAIG